jgi:ABC-type nitrate/sulfonate/bicarbonate transport system permease component
MGDRAVIESPPAPAEAPRRRLGLRIGTAEPGPQRGVRRRLAGLSALSVIAGLGVWQLLSTYVVDPFLLPSPWVVAKAFRELTASGVLLDDIVVSLKRILIGWLAGSAVAVPLGLLIGTSRVARALADPYIHFFRFIPGIALIALFMAWFGVGDLSKIMLIVYGTAFLVVLNTATGVASIPDDKLHAARCLGAGPVRIFLRVTFPAAVPYIFMGMRLALAMGFLMIVAAELIAADSGIGYLIWNSRIYFRIDWMFVGIVTLGLLGLAADRIWRTIGRVLLGHYLREAARY